MTKTEQYNAELFIDKELNDATQKYLTAEVVYRVLSDVLNDKKGGTKQQDELLAQMQKRKDEQELLKRQVKHLRNVREELQKGKIVL